MGRKTGYRGVLWSARMEDAASGRNTAGPALLSLWPTPLYFAERIG